MSKKIVLGICGSIAAYKAVDIVRALKQKGFDVFVMMTKNAKKFVHPRMFESLCGNPVITDLFKEKNVIGDYLHLSLAEKADLVLIAPATANVISKIANGICDDIVTTTVISTKSPVLIAPAMNENMWLNPVVQENVKKLKNFGYQFIGPEYGELACGKIGWGRLAKVEDIVSKVVEVVTNI